jgi:beta-N-acetylhexosaminidase
MVGMSGTYPDAWLLGRVRDGEIGGIILFAANISPNLGKALTALQEAARAGRNPPLLIATDQEGGTVKRLPSDPPTEAAAAMSPSDTLSQGVATGLALARLGINTDLAPVADVAHKGNFLGTRIFGSNPTRVALDACNFAEGLAKGGVDATFKHFPGLGAADTNTDTSPTTVTLSAADLSTDLGAYRLCKPAIVMISNATYPALDPGEPAVFSSTIIQSLLRGKLGFGGVTISDTLTAPGVASITAAVRASNAGIDILLYPDSEHYASGVLHELLSALKHNQLSPQELRSSAGRIWALAERPIKTGA